MDPCHYNFQSFENYHYYSSIWKLTITIYVLFEPCHFICSNGIGSACRRMCGHRFFVWSKIPLVAPSFSLTYELRVGPCLIPIHLLLPPSCSWLPDRPHMASRRGKEGHLPGPATTRWSDRHACPYSSVCSCYYLLLPLRNKLLPLAQQVMIDLIIYSCIH